MNNEEIMLLKEDVNLEIKKKKYETLRYVLFNEEDKMPFAIHLFFENGKFMVNSRDERSYVIGKTFEFSDFQVAKLKFLKLLDLTIEISKEEIKLGYSVEYSSPLWDKKIDSKN
ncbi:hypothetical protein RVZ54_001738 [Listeria monocytogenes]|uniref:Imm59 family immunity protein n=1 Tax=Listeria monocytogenes TaxID=1639 RepID=UPI00087524C7|nr:Imm59 family immunity protein [Listeria monocytogenes]ECW7470409.1 hypothetical protein [Listeria monocytogenes]EDN9305749.1 hypothetical protein [Listeria monocytogenes]EDN9973130.1 hypothetical protein [Listeria monocytogenes]EHT7836157.1 hypothetical protein [Listeria monocytogenes]ELK7957369.1 hypothetical protein [Listeria monocytogenes]